MNFAYREWLDRSNIGDRLPRGAFFKRRQPEMAVLAHELTLGHLNDALGHYLDITGADPSRNFHTTPPDELAEDKVTYAYLIKKNGAGQPVYDANECARFMAAVWKHHYPTALAFARLHSPH
ncbi:TPA: hypothetical protein ACHTH4_004770 [Escherichia coli]